MNVPTGLRRVVVGAATTALTLLPILPAAAHPALVPAQLPAGGGPTRVVLPHGCARDGIVPGDGIGLPTDEVVLRAASPAVQLEALAVPGWDVLDLPGGDIGWRHAAAGATGVVQLPVVVQADASSLGRVLVHQACGDVAVRWVEDAGVTPSAVLAVGTRLPADLDHPPPGEGAASFVPSGLLVGLAGLGLLTHRTRRDRRSLAPSPVSS